MSTSAWRSPWMDFKPARFSETANYDTDRTDKTGFVSSVSSIPSHFEKTRGLIDPHDRSTWPAYLVRLERLSLEQFGPEAAARQVRAELAFLANAEAAGWMVLTSGLPGGGP